MAVPAYAVAALGVALAIVYIRYRRSIRLARARVAAGSRIALAACGPVEYAEVGDGPPVLAIHGAGGGYDQGLEIFKPLAEAGYRVIAVSRFGYLGTPCAADATPEAQADAHACLLDALNIRRAVIAGASAGGPSSMQFALRYPERTAALVLLVPAAYVPRPDGAPSLHLSRGVAYMLDTALRSDFLFWALLRLAPMAMFRTILGTPPAVAQNASPKQRAYLTQMAEHVLPVSARRLGLLNDAAITSALPRYELEKIAAPTLVMGIADDLYGIYDGAKYSAGHIPHARFVSYPTGGHLGVGHQQETLDEIIAFLQEKTQNC